MTFKEETGMKPRRISRRSFLRRTAPFALGATAMSNCMRDLYLVNSALAFTAPTDYKALVCVFLGGGNDANNMIIPTVTSEYANYATARTPVLALPETPGFAPISGPTTLTENVARQPAFPAIT